MYLYIGNIIGINAQYIYEQTDRKDTLLVRLVLYNVITYLFFRN